jgi:uncharacterized protein YecT (DUF1311 family)
MKPLTILLLLALCFGPHVQPKAAEKKIITTQDMFEEAEREFKKADAQLNATYQSLLRYLDPKETEALRIAQRAWLAFRDADAKLSGLEFDGGTLEPVVIMSAMASLTRERTKHLKLHLETRASTRAPVEPAKPANKAQPKQP